MQFTTVIIPAPRQPSANDGSFAHRPIRPYELELRMAGGGVTTFTTLARHRNEAIDHAGAALGDDIAGVNAKKGKA